MNIVMTILLYTALFELSYEFYCGWRWIHDEDGLVKVARKKFGKTRGDPMGAVDQSQRVTRASTFGALFATSIAKMSVLLETSAGDITIDLYVDEAPKACEK